VASTYVLPPDYKILSETAEVFTKALLLGMETEAAAPGVKDNFADDAPVEILPFEEALAYMKKRVSVDRETYYALNDKMRYRAFTVGRLADGDAVRRVQSMLAKSLEDGSGLTKFVQMTEGELADAAGMGRGTGWYYETVYRTNTSTAYNVGRAIAFEETPPAALELVGIDDMRQTETCHALTVPPFRRPYGDPVWQSLWPGFHFNCRTTVRAIYDEAEIEEAGGPEKFYSQGTPDYTPAEGFGKYPLDKTDTWWDMTGAMRERAVEYGLEAEFLEAKEKLIGVHQEDVSTLKGDHSEDDTPARIMDREADYSKDTPSSAASKELDYLWKITKDTNLEHMSIMTNDGKVLYTLEGLRDRVNIPEEIEKFIFNSPDNSLTVFHTHTNKTSFSDDDFWELCRFKAAKEFQLRSIDKAIYKASIGSGARLAKKKTLIDKKNEISDLLLNEPRFAILNKADKHGNGFVEETHRRFIYERNIRIKEFFRWYFK
jgi:hypothetical protein